MALAMPNGNSEISTFRAGVLLSICAVVAVGLVVLMQYMKAPREPLQDPHRGKDKNSLPIQQQYNTDSLGKHKARPNRPAAGGRMPASLPATQPDEP